MGLNKNHHAIYQPQFFHKMILPAFYMGSSIDFTKLSFGGYLFFKFSIISTPNTSLSNYFQHSVSTIIQEKLQIVIDYFIILNLKRNIFVVTTIMIITMPQLRSWMNFFVNTRIYIVMNNEHIQTLLLNGCDSVLKELT